MTSVTTHRSANILILEYNKYTNMCIFSELDHGFLRSFSLSYQFVHKWDGNFIVVFFLKVHRSKIVMEAQILAWIEFWATVEACDRCTWFFSEIRL